MKRLFLTLGILFLTGTAHAVWNGTLDGSPTFTSGKFNNGMNCSVGNGGHLPNPGPMQVGANNPFTVEFWFKKSAAPTSTAVVIGLQYNWWWGANTTSGTATWHYITVINGSTNICDGNWHSIALTYDGTTSRQYVDGTLDGFSVGGGIDTPNQPETIGTGYAGGTSFDTTSQLDEMAVSNVAQYTGSSYTPQSSPFSPGRSGQIALYHMDSDLSDSNGASSLQVTENLLVTSPTVSNIQITAPIVGGTGTGPFSYVWFSSTTINFSTAPANTLSNGGGISGATTANLVDARTQTGGPYYYRATVTDAINNTYTWPSRQVYVGTTTVNISAIGDSTSVEQAQNNQLAPSDVVKSILLAYKGIRQVNLVNSAVSGSSSGSWYNGGAQSNLTNALAAAGGSFSGYWVIVRLGVNDAQGGGSASTFNTNMTGLCSYIVSHGGKVILDYPVWREPGLFGENTSITFNESTSPLLVSYMPYLAALVDNVNIFAGDTTSYQVFNVYPQKYYSFGSNSYWSAPGAIHENVDGSIIMGTAEAKALIQAAGL